VEQREKREKINMDKMRKISKITAWKSAIEQSGTKWAVEIRLMSK
jgi:hypothetical protein